jgi:hypothetical protein
VAKKLHELGSAQFSKILHWPCGDIYTSQVCEPSVCVMGFKKSSKVGGSWGIVGCFSFVFHVNTQVKSLCPKTDETMMILLWWNRFDHYIFERVGPALWVFHSCCYSFKSPIFSKILLSTVAYVLLLQLVIAKKKKKKGLIFTHAAKEACFIWRVLENEVDYFFLLMLFFFVY